jgi:hypothetical protein
LTQAPTAGSPSVSRAIAAAGGGAVGAERPLHGELAGDVGLLFGDLGIAVDDFVLVALDGAHDRGLARGRGGGGLAGGLPGGGAGRGFGRGRRDGLLAGRGREVELDDRHRAEHDLGVAGLGGVGGGGVGVLRRPRPRRAAGVAPRRRPAGPRRGARRVRRGSRWR